MPDGVAKFRAIGPVPGINGVERFERGDWGIFDDADQVKAGVGNRPDTVGKTNQREHRAGRPDLGVIRARSFELRQREDHVADGAGTDQQASTHYFRLYSFRAFSRRTMRASSTARSRVTSLSRIIPVNAIPSASRPVVLASQPASSHPISGGAKG